ncbi:4916_t:CDS:2 [Diversispora eburnea]|uniref:4916_t:CDS:1 n=1 Tax=Diversispora eburnea TaxID=1213867 RepID=A0A9N9AMY4_9GLOM|nr:4916_t:CDS:2 [Diversispora eburnea]
MNKDKFTPNKTSIFPGNNELTKRHFDRIETHGSPKKIKTPTKNELINNNIIPISSSSLSNTSNPFLVNEEYPISIFNKELSNQKSFLEDSPASKLSENLKWLSLQKQNSNIFNISNIEVSEITRRKDDNTNIQNSSSNIDFSNINQMVSNININQTPWIERFSPLNNQELALDQVKIKEIRNWLDRTLADTNYNNQGLKNHKLLIIHGPSGSVKTTAIKVIAKEQQVGVSEFGIESTVSYINDQYLSIMDQLQSFITWHSNNLSEETRKANFDEQIVLIDVNTCLVSPDSKDKFNSLIEKWLKKRTNYWPLVLTYTDEFLIIDYEKNPGYSVKKNVFYGSIISNNILGSNFCTKIEFSSIKPSVIEKVLNKYIRKIYQDKISDFVGRRFIKRIKSECRGNIVTAIMKLERAMKLLDEHSSFRKMVEDRVLHQKKIEWNIYEGELNKKVLEILSLCDGISRIDRFNTINKFLSNPRNEDPQKYYVSKEIMIDPRDLKVRPPLKYNPDEIIEDMAMTPDDLLYVLHNNVPRIYEDIYEMSYAAEILSLTARGTLAAHTHTRSQTGNYDYFGSYKCESKMRENYRMIDYERQKDPNHSRLSNSLYGLEIYPYLQLMKKKRKNAITVQNTNNNTSEREQKPRTSVRNKKIQVESRKEFTKSINGPVNRSITKLSTSEIFQLYEN